MPKFYISFGQNHAHRHGKVTLDKDCIGAIEAPDEDTARDKAFEWFGPKWSMLYNQEPNMEYFPRGIINL